MKQNNKITPEGTRDLLFEECMTQRAVENMLADVFTLRGFNQVVTPGLEFYDVFDPGRSGIGQEVMYKLTDKRGRLMVLRPDSTLPIARLTATRLQNQQKPLRLFYTQRVYRSNPGLTGKNDEVMQSGIELLGAAGRRADLEAVVTAIEAMSKCVPNFRIELGHAGFFRALAAKLPVSDDVREDIRLSIEAKNYPALNQILDGLDESPAVEAMRRLPRLFGGEEVFAEAARLCVDEAAEKTLSYLRELYGALSALPMGGRIMIDLGLVQRIDYYTDIIFSAYVEDCGDAVLTGGRYDNLLELFGAPMSAIGFAVNVDAIAKILIEHGRASGPEPADVLVHGDAGFELKALTHASGLVERGCKCENSVFESREQALDYAKRQGIARVDFVSETVETVRLPGKDGRA